MTGDQPARGRATRVSRRRDEAGEMASWLILGASLALIASLLGGIIGPAMRDLAAQVTGSAAEAPAGSTNPPVVTDPLAGPGTILPGVPDGPTASTTDPATVSPSEKADETLVAVISEVDNGGDLGLSEDELDDVHDLLADLRAEELNYVLASLTDEQAARIFHNVHSSCILCDDWNDTERREFYANLARADVEVRNDLAAQIAAETDIDEGTYLEVLQGLQVDVSLGAKPSGAEIDVWVEAALPGDYIDGPIGDGDIGDGKVIIVNDEDYERAWRYQIRNQSTEAQLTSALIYQGSRGFVDSEGRLWVQDSASNTPGTAVHEVIHGYSADEIRSNEGLNEGVTEYFTRQVLATIDDPTTTADEAQRAIAERGYTLNYRFVEELVGVVGEDAVAAAYFDGDIDALEDAYIESTSRTEEDFETLWDTLDPRSVPDDPATPENESVERWQDARELLEAVPEP